MSCRLGPLPFTLALIWACTEPITVPKTMKEGPARANGNASRQPNDEANSSEMQEPTAGDEPEQAVAEADDAGSEPDDPPTSPPLEPMDAGSPPPGDAGPTSPDSPPADEPIAPDPDERIIGTWFGGLSDVRGPYTACVVVTQVNDEDGAAGTCFYGGAVNCRTSLTYRGKASDQYRFEEIQAAGTGCPPGIARLQLNQDNTAEYGWSLPNSEDILVAGTFVSVAECPD
jgi:hypothetical protein